MSEYIEMGFSFLFFSFSKVSREPLLSLLKAIGHDDPVRMAIVWLGLDNEFGPIRGPISKGQLIFFMGV